MEVGGYDIQCKILEVTGNAFIEVDNERKKENLNLGVNHFYHTQRLDQPAIVSFGDEGGSVKFDDCSVIKLPNYEPMETHPDWSRFNSAVDSPTIYEPMSGALWNTRTLPDGEDHAMMYTGYGAITDVDMSCKIWYEGTNPQYGSYIMVKGQDFDNFVGVTSYNNKIMIYQRFRGAWGKIAEMPVGGTFGKVLRFTITGTACELFVDGVSKITGTTDITGSAYMGMMIRQHPLVGLMISEMKFYGLKEGTEEQIVPCNRIGWTINQSSAFNNDYLGLEAFNCTTASGNDCWVSVMDEDPNVIVGQWVSVSSNVGQKYFVGRMEMKGRTVISNDHMNARRPDPLVLLGSNDGTNWIEIQRWTNTGPWDTAEIKTFIIINQMNAYNKFRIVWEQTAADVLDEAQIGWIKMYGFPLDGVAPNNTLVPSNTLVPEG